MKLQDRHLFPRLSRTRKKYEKTFGIFVVKNNLGMKDGQHLVHGRLSYAEVEQGKRARSAQDTARMLEEDEMVVG